ncbi:hypothetical protein GWK26_08615 [haloarchaeon 3A1-DGR]|nr:hypothetical protein GWK26_08615 [haloarchaeon 3A1-DGR]
MVDDSRFVGDDGIKGRELFETIFVGVIFAIATTVAQIVQLPFEFLSAIYDTAYGGLSTFGSTAFDPNAWGVGVAWETASTALADWGLLSFVIAALVIAGWLAIIGMLIRAVQGGISGG